MDRHADLGLHRASVLAVGGKKRGEGEPQVAMRLNRNMDTGGPGLPYFPTKYGKNHRAITVTIKNLWLRLTGGVRKTYFWAKFHKKYGCGSPMEMLLPLRRAASAIVADAAPLISTNGRSMHADCG